MGNTETKERQLFVQVILKLLSKREIKVKKTNIQSFFAFVQEQCPWSPQEGTVNLDTWEKVGKQLKAYCAQRGPEKIPTNTFSLWNMIRDALDPALESGKVPFKEENKYEKVPVKKESESEKAPIEKDSENEMVPDKKESENKELIHTHQELRAMLAAMKTNSYKDEKKDQVSPQDEKALEEAAAQYHSDEDWPLLAKKSS